MLRNFDLKQKKVIDLKTAEFLGYIQDMDIDFETGKINSVSVPKKCFFGAFTGGENVVVPWEKVISIGKEYVIICQNDEIKGENLQNLKK